MRLEWPTLGLIILCYGSWLAAGLWLWPLVPALALAVMALMGALQSSLVHECLHGHPTRHRLINEALVTLPLTLLHPYRRYKATHLAHHHDEQLTDPLHDPESYYLARYRYAAMPAWFRRVLRANNTLLGRIVMGPWLAGVAFLVSDGHLLRADARGVRRAWALHVPAVAVVLALVWAMGIPIWLYVLAVCWPALSLISLRTFAEHRWHETPEGRTIIVESSPLAWVFLFNNLHIVHHQLPSAPWYRLPRLYAERRAYWQDLNQGYVFPNYRALWRQWALTAKEPVAHPVLRREAEPGVS
ncbi:fatty acid desaturase [Pararhodobacter sp.]|uniref:fatty acid desaturase n=1 Tax=Pararhodobacter sp. TaxID=2127056 RepID=UPI002AFE4708|nr:fatty acid desaturase [Pararhodobacter sp.]